MAYISINVETVKGKDGLKLENLISYYKSLSDNVVTVGVHKDKGRELVKRAAHTEFGTTLFEEGWGTPFGHVYVVPPRPAIRMYLYPEMIDTIKTTYIDSIDTSKKLGVKNPVQDAKEAQEVVGEVSKTMQKEKMLKGGYDQSTNDTGLDPEHNGAEIAPGIYAKTIAYKGFDDPWIQTGETLNAVDFKIEKKK